jgi:hypothetical protein
MSLIIPSWEPVGVVYFPQWENTVQMVRHHFLKHHLLMQIITVGTWGA